MIHKVREQLGKGVTFWMACEMNWTTLRAHLLS